MILPPSLSRSYTCVHMPVSASRSSMQISDAQSLTGASALRSYLQALRSYLLLQKQVPCVKASSLTLQLMPWHRSIRGRRTTCKYNSPAVTAQLCNSCCQKHLSQGCAREPAHLAEGCLDGQLGRVARVHA